MVFKIVMVTVAACVVVGLLHQTAAIPPGAVNPGSNPWIPPWIANAPFMPKWVQCDAAEPLGASCQDCNTKRVCTGIGGFIKRCTDATKPHCNLGECSSTPSAECTPAVVPTAESSPAEIPVAETSPAVPIVEESPAEVSPAETLPAEESPTADASPAEESQAHEPAEVSPVEGQEVPAAGAPAV